jgi:hypothetical protein
MFRGTSESMVRSLSLTLLLAVVFAPSAFAQSGRLAARPAVIHVTDLFRPYADPDDHWDLASVYAQAQMKEIDLKGIVIDYPPNREVRLNPDVIAVAQLNHITGLSVPVAIGTPRKMTSRKDIQEGGTPSDMAAVQLIIDILRSSDVPVIINVVGQSRDVAIAGNREPALFARKCAGIYLNAGTGTRTKGLITRKEYNVRLDEAAYAAIFDLQCPVYWLPCFEDNNKVRGEWAVMAYGSYFRFLHRDVLPTLAPRLQNYFTYMYRKTPGPYWLTALAEPVDSAMVEEVAPTFRNMWCTAGFLHVVGRTVTTEGKIVPLKEVRGQGVFSFDPIRVKSDDTGETEWQDDKTSRLRFILHVGDVAHYQSAMTTALRTLVQTLK